MSEEEIIKILKDTISLFNNDTHCFTHSDDERVGAIQGLLDLYNKEKEKNKKLEKQMGKDLDVVYLQGVYNERDRWKSKIREKIEEKQNRINKLHPASDCVIIDDLENQIQVLQELLED